MHHHLINGELLYDYPRIQFKVIDKYAVLLGLAEGGELLEQVWMTVDTARLGRENLPVLESRMTRHTGPIGESVSRTRYYFITPWLPLNQKNYARFMKLKSWRERSELLERILVGNLLSFSKSFQYSVKRQLVADCSSLRQITTTLKGIKLIGFTGQFSVNFLLPHLAGLGKSVSRGFGTVSAAENQKNVFMGI